MTGRREPQWAFEPVVILPYQSEWPTLAINLMRVIEDLAGANLIDIEHIGSTSVPGLSAKPIDRKSTRLNSSHVSESRMPSSA